jgi:hypothetical protein
VSAVPSPIDPRLAAAWLASLTELLGFVRDALAESPADAALETLHDELRRLRTLVRRVRYGLVDASELRLALLQAAGGVARGGAAAVSATEPLAAWATAVLPHVPEHTAVRREFYVYVHRDSTGAVFYVGKGRARRAWSRSRTPVWHRYVDDHLEGRYDVEIVRDALTHGEALEHESAEIARHGPALVNWLNPARAFDAAALERVRLLRADTLARVGSAQFLEERAPVEALRRYRLALADVLVYSRMPVERGRLADLKDVDLRGEPIVLDRLTRLLERLGRGEEARAAAARYFAEFPAAAATAAGQRVRRRCERLARLDSRDGGPRTGGARVLG